MNKPMATRREPRFTEWVDQVDDDVERVVRCAHAIRDHLGGKPELAGELVESLVEMASMAEAHGWGDATTGRQITLRRARALLSRITEAAPFDELARRVTAQPRQLGTYSE